MLSFFDMDGTLIDGDCGVLFVRHCIARRMLSVGELRDWGRFLVQIARRGVHEPEIALAKNLLLRSRLRWGEAQSNLLYDGFFRSAIEPRIRSEVAGELHQCAHEGKVFLITANLRSMAVRLGAALGVPEERCLGAEPLRDAAGKPTGEVARPICIEEDRARLVRELALVEGVPLEEVRAFGNSLHDLAMLRAVGKPCAVHPGRALRRIARREKMRILG